MPQAQNYTLGRGKVYFARFKTGTQDPDFYRYVGNTPELSLTITSDVLDHFSSDEGIREKDDSVPLQVTRNGSCTTDNIHPENIALFFYGEAAVLSASAIASASHAIADVQQGRFYQLGQSSSNPVGHRRINPSGITVTSDPTGTTFVAGDDYVINVDTGLLEIVEGGAIAASAAQDILVTYAVLASNRDHIISGSTPVEGAMKFLAANPKGKDFDYTMPWTKVTPNGDYALKGDTWQTIPYNLEFLKPTWAEAIYVDGRPYAP